MALVDNPPTSFLCKRKEKFFVNSATFYIKILISSILATCGKYVVKVKICQEPNMPNTVKPRFSNTIRSGRLFENRFVRKPNHIFPLQII